MATYDTLHTEGERMKIRIKIDIENVLEKTIKIGKLKYKVFTLMTRYYLIN